MVMTRNQFIVGLLGMLTLPWSPGIAGEKNMSTTGKVLIYDHRTDKVEEVDRVVKTDDEWRKLLSLEEFKITRKKGTEPAFSGRYASTKDKGIYQCVCCGTDLFVVHGACRGALCTVRCPPWPRVQRRAAAHGQAVLHEFSRPKVRACREVKT
jgi:SelR domain